MGAHLKPALLRQMFHLGCAYSGQILSYQKMLGQLTDAGNTVTLAHYLDLLQGAGMVAGLSKYAHGLVRQRGSSPKLQVLNTALMTAQDKNLMPVRGSGDWANRHMQQPEESERQPKKQPGWHGANPNGGANPANWRALYRAASGQSDY